MKSTFDDLFQNFKFPLSHAIKIYLPACLFIFVAYKIFRVFGISMYELTADPAEIVGKPPYVGFFSQIGCLLWSGAAAICIFTAFLTKLDQNTSRRWFIFLLASFFLLASLLIDDLFQFHEYYAGIFLGFTNVPLKDHKLQNLFEIAYLFIMYFVGFGLYLFYFRQHIRDTNYVYFILAIFLFGLSIVLDIGDGIIPLPEYLSMNIEDSSKLLGIFSWLAYFYRTCSLILRQLIAKLALQTG